MIQKSRSSKSKSRGRFAKWLAKAKSVMKESLSKGKSKLNKNDQIANQADIGFRGFDVKKNKIKEEQEEQNEVTNISNLE